jgi:hypothetical protein
MNIPVTMCPENYDLDGDSSQMLEDVKTLLGHEYHRAEQYLIDSYCDSLFRLMKNLYKSNIACAILTHQH